MCVHVYVAGGGRWVITRCSAPLELARRSLSTWEKLSGPYCATSARASTTPRCICVCVRAQVFCVFGCVHVGISVSHTPAPKRTLSVLPIFSCSLANPHKHTHAHTYTHTLTPPPPHTHTHTHTPTHAHAHAHTRTHSEWSPTCGESMIGTQWMRHVVATKHASSTTAARCVCVCVCWCAWLCVCRACVCRVCVCVCVFFSYWDVSE